MPAPEPDERTLLIRRDIPKPIEPSLSDAITPKTSVNADGHSNDQGNFPKDDNGDEEAGKAADLENPLFEGNPEMAKKLHILFPAVALGILLASADQTLVVSSYARMGSDLNALNNTSWIATAYFLTLTSFQPLYGKLSDIFGRKAALLFAYTIFGIGCLFCGLARTLEELVAARAFAGIGGGGMTTVVSILLSDIVPLRTRGSWQGYLNIVYAMGSSCGGPLGGVLSDTIGWRWAFIGQAPMCILAILAVYIFLDIPKKDQSGWYQKLKKIDFLGAFTLVAAVFMLLVGMDRGSNVAWSDKIAIAFCCVSIPLFVVFILVEMKVASHPFAPGHVIFKRALAPSYLCNFFTLAAFMSVLFYVPLYFQALEGASATTTGLRLIPIMIFSVSGSLIGGLYMQKTGKYYWITVFAFILDLAGSIVIFLFSGFVFSSSLAMMIGMACMSFGGGVAITTTLLSVLANADSADQAIATACTYLFRSVGSVTGVSLAATVVQQTLRTRLRAGLESGREADEVVDNVRQSLDYIKGLEPAVRDIVRRCYQMSTNAAFGVVITIVICALFVSFFIKERRLSK